MIRLWRARLINHKSEIHHSHPEWVVLVTGGPPDAVMNQPSSMKAWEDYLRTVRTRVSNSSEFPNSEWLAENFPDGFLIDLKIIEVNSYGVARLD